MQYVTACIHNFTSFYMNPILDISIFDLYFFINFLFFSIFVYVNVYSVGAGIITLMSISDGLEPYVFCRKMEKTRSMNEEVDGEVSISRLSWHPLLYR